MFKHCYLERYKYDHSSLIHCGGKICCCAADFPLSCCCPPILSLTPSIFTLAVSLSHLYNR